MEAELTVVNSSHSRGLGKQREQEVAPDCQLQDLLFSIPFSLVKPYLPKISNQCPLLGTKHSLLRACGNVTLPNHNGGLEKEFHLVDYYIKSTHWRLSFQLFSVCVCTRPHALAYTCLCVGTRAQPPVSSSGFHLPP